MFYIVFWQKFIRLLQEPKMNGEEPWNSSELSTPSIVTFKYQSKDCKKGKTQIFLVGTNNNNNNIFCFVSEIKTVSKTISKAIEFLSSQSQLTNDAGMLYKLIKKYKQNFKYQHRFRQLQKIHVGLEKLLNLDFVNILENVSGYLPDISFIPEEVYLPSRQNIEYILLRIQGIAKLCCRIVGLCREAFGYYLKSLTTGHYFDFHTVVMSILASLWKICRDVCQKMVVYYNKLFQIRHKLRKSKKDWLTAGYEFPEDLVSWLGAEWTDEIAIKEGTLKIQRNTTIFNLLNVEEDDYDDGQPPEKKLKVEIDEAENSQGIKTELKKLKEEEEGELIERPEVLVRQKRSIKSIKTKYEILKFLDEEKLLRLQKDELALTKKVPNLFYNKFVQNIKAQQHKKSTSDFVEFFKKEFKLLVKMSYNL